MFYTNISVVIYKLESGNVNTIILPQLVHLIRKHISNLNTNVLTQPQYLSE